MINPQIKSLSKLYSGKVRDLYSVDEHILLMVASDRLSAFDVILNQTVPYKGSYLTQISLFWFEYLKDIMPNHLLPQNQWSEHLKKLSADEYKSIQYQFMLVKKLKPIPVEVIVRAYLAGSSFKDYMANSGVVSGIKLPDGLRLADKLPEPIFTPSTKAAVGTHDENITFKQCVDLIGLDLTNNIMTSAFRLYNKAAKKALDSGIIIADTKFEFGLDEDNKLTLMDEVLTPDSSRFWDANKYRVNVNPDSFDKQFIRDYLDLEIKWDKISPIPDIPASIIQQTANKYKEILRRFNIHCGFEPVA